MIPRLVPDTVEGAVRALYRMLSQDDRMELSVDISGPLSPKMSRFVRFHRATQQHVIRYCFLEVGNPELLADVRRIKGTELSVADAAAFITNRLTEHGLLMYQLVTWCVQRFGLGGINRALITELTVPIKKDGENYHPRLAARYIIQFLVEKPATSRARYQHAGVAGKKWGGAGAATESQLRSIKKKEERDEK